MFSLPRLLIFASIIIPSQLIYSNPVVNAAGLKCAIEILQKGIHILQLQRMERMQ